jgi:DNA-binding GntR family transcriptional regulator
MTDDFIETSFWARAAPGLDPAAERAIERDIFRGCLRPGEKLREEELVERFDASRPHVREALARLAQIGIVVKERNRGAFVRRFTRTRCVRSTRFREILQRQAALRIAPPATAETIRSLSSINDAY